MIAQFIRSAGSEWWKVGGLLALLCSVPACQDGPFLQVEEFRMINGAERYTGGWCVSAQEGNGMGSGGGPVPSEGGAGGEGDGTLMEGLGYSYEGTGDSVHFKATVGGETIAERDYTTDFLLSGEKDEVIVEGGGEKIRFLHWGGAKCGEIRELDDPSEYE
jgi:hypothetical protein